MKLIYLNSNFALTLGYLNPALNNPALLVGSDRKYENRSKYKNKTQTAVINIVSYHRCLCYVFDPAAMVKFLSPSPPLPLNVRKAVASISCYKWVWRTDSSDVSGWYPMFKSVSDFRD